MVFFPKKVETFHDVLDSPFLSVHLYLPHRTEVAGPRWQKFSYMMHKFFLQYVNTTGKNWTQLTKIRIDDANFVWLIFCLTNSVQLQIQKNETFQIFGVCKEYTIICMSCFR